MTNILTCDLECFKLPSEVANLAIARNTLCDRYPDSGLTFTLDGKLVGDLGEAVAAELFDLKLAPTGEKGVDAWTRDGSKTSVQVKASGILRNSNGSLVSFPGFSYGTYASHVLLFHLDYENCRGEVIYNGPFQYVFDAWKAEDKNKSDEKDEKGLIKWEKTRGLNANIWIDLNKKVVDQGGYRLEPVERGLLLSPCSYQRIGRASWTPVSK